MRHNEIGGDQLERELREDDVLLTAKEACEFIGGPKKPIDPERTPRRPSRHLLAPQVHPTPGISRWVQTLVSKQPQPPMQRGPLIGYLPQKWKNPSIRSERKGFW